MSAIRRRENLSPSPRAVSATHPRRFVFFFFWLRLRVKARTPSHHRKSAICMCAHYEAKVHSLLFFFFFFFFGCMFALWTGLAAPYWRSLSVVAWGFWTHDMRRGVVTHIMASSGSPLFVFLSRRGLQNTDTISTTREVLSTLMLTLIRFLDVL